MYNTTNKRARRCFHLKKLSMVSNIISKENIINCNSRPTKFLYNSSYQNAQVTKILMNPKWTKLLVYYNIRLRISTLNFLFRDLRSHLYQFVLQNPVKRTWQSDRRSKTRSAFCFLQSIRYFSEKIYHIEFPKEALHGRGNEGKRRKRAVLFKESSRRSTVKRSVKRRRATVLNWTLLTISPKWGKGHLIETGVAIFPAQPPTPGRRLIDTGGWKEVEQRNSGWVGNRAARAVLVNSNPWLLSRFFIPLARLTKTPSREPRDRPVFVLRTISTRIFSRVATHRIH